MSKTVQRDLRAEKDAANVKETNLEMAKLRLEEQREVESKLVRGRFKYLEVPGGTHEFKFRKYKNDPIQKYSFKDNEIYEIPLAVARHLNNNCSYPSYSYKNDESGRPRVTAGEKVHRMSFVSLEFA